MGFWMNNWDCPLQFSRSQRHIQGRLELFREIFSRFNAVNHDIPGCFWLRPTKISLSIKSYRFDTTVPIDDLAKQHTHSTTSN
jgi:hypothetical protein